MKRLSRSVNGKDGCSGFVPFVYLKLQSIVVGFYEINQLWDNPVFSD